MLLKSRASVDGRAFVACRAPMYTFARPLAVHHLVVSFSRSRLFLSMFQAFSRLLSACIPSLRSRKHSATVLLSGEASSLCLWCLLIAPQSSLRLFQVRIESPADPNARSFQDLHPVGVIRTHSWAKSHEKASSPIRQTVQIATTLPVMKISNLVALGQLELKAGEHVNSLAASLAHTCIEELRHREDILQRKSGRQRTSKQSDSAVLARVFVKAESERQDSVASGKTGVVYLARVVIPNSRPNRRNKCEWERAE